MSFRLLLLATLALGLAACQADEPEAVTVETAPVVVDPVEPMPADTMVVADDVTVQGTIDAATANGGVTSIPAAAALANIDGWIAKLDGNADAAPIVENLRTLRTQISASPIDGMAVGQTLTTLGEQTTAAAAMGGDQQSALEALGGALSEAGAALTGM